MLLARTHALPEALQRTILAMYGTQWLRLASNGRLVRVTLRPQ
jgi:hypothetical protein